MRAFRNILACILALSLVTGAPATVFALEPETNPSDDSARIQVESEDDGEEPDLSLTYGETRQEQPEQDDGEEPDLSLAYGETQPEQNDGSDEEPEPDDSERETTGDSEASSQPEADVTPSGMSLGFSSAEEFRALLSENEGGVVTLTGDVVWDGYWDAIKIKKPTTVLMGDYGIHIPPDAYLWISGPVRFEGNGVVQPLFYIEGSINADGAEIVATGDGATALYAPVDIYLYFVSITARGKGSVGIHSAGSVVLNLCEVTANGAAVVSDTGEIRLDGCHVLPEPENAEVIRREAVPGQRIQENGICVSSIGSLEDTLSENRWAEYYLLDVKRIISFDHFSTLASWKNLPADTSIPGEYSILCVPTGIPDWIPLEGMTAYKVPLHIVAENQPHIQSAHRFLGDTVMMQFFSEIVDYDALTLWYSSDSGQTWRDFLENKAAEVSPFGAWAEELEPNRVYLFRLEVEGGPMQGFSNTLAFPYYDSDPDREGGGDRTGADRFPQTGSGGGGGNSPPLDDKSSPGYNGNRGGSNTNSKIDTDGDAEYGNATTSSLPIVEEELPEGTIRSNTAAGGPLLKTDMTAPAFRFGGGTNAPVSVRLRPVAEEIGTQKEFPISKAEAPSESIEVPPEADTAKAQPSLPQPPFQAGLAMVVTGSAAAVLAGASGWIKARKLHR